MWHGLGIEPAIIMHVRILQTYRSICPLDNSLCPIGIWLERNILCCCLRPWFVFKHDFFFFGRGESFCLAILFFVSFMFSVHLLTYTSCFYVKKRISFFFKSMFYNSILLSWQCFLLIFFLSLLFSFHFSAGSGLWRYYILNMFLFVMSCFLYYFMFLRSPILIWCFCFT